MFFQYAEHSQAVVVHISCGDNPWNVFLLKNVNKKY